MDFIVNVYSVAIFSCNDESKPKITRSAARHIRRKRLVSAKRAAENGSSTLEIFDLEPSNDTTNPENQGEVQSLSKSKARRLRRRKKIESDKNLKTNIEEKKDIDSSPNATTGEPINKKTTANEQELFENEKNRQISECSINNKILRTIDDPEIRSEIIEEIAITRETRVSSNRENRVAQSNGNVGPPNLRTQSSIISATREQNILRMNSQEKTREQIKAEREAKKAAKAAAKSKGKSVKPEIKENASSTECKTEVSKAKEVNETRGDVVDGEIIAKINKTAVASICTKKPEIVATELHAESKNEVKSKSELRAERRAKQEAQRAAKQVVAPEKPKLKVVNLIKVTNVPVKKIEDPVPKIAIPIITKNAHEVNLFKHLYHEREQARINAPIVNSNIHPAIVRLGVQYADKVIVGSNARCVALLAAVKQLIQDFERPSQADFTRGLEASLQETSTYLHHCRPLAVSMQNALKHLKWQMTQLSTTTSDEDAKTKLGNAIDTYIQEQILLADKAISITIQTKISNGDVILTYGYSSLICKILCDAHDTGRQFRVVVVDGRPWLEGREQLRRLAKHGLECSYVLINALSFIMPEVSKVFLGAHAILANGAVMSRVGTAQVALMAKSFNVPVLVACETHKTCERVQTDSIVYNEIADADKLAENLMGSTKKTSLINWRGKKLLNLLNITYDVTPADLVTAVVTELAILPCTSVPVILRIKPSEI